jgi:hypothetical protein
MKTMKWLMVTVLMAGMLALVGCGKGKSSAQGNEPEINGVKVAMPQLQQSLIASKDPEIQASAGKLAYGLRYGQYPAVQQELAKLAANPNLTADQKKLVATVDEQMKQVVAKGQPTQ